ncbi:hypothetical protein K9O30_14705 [Clostridium bowmanii]|uniref:hypothetical protein n=1 Tax=Clostridium bowmanii TaxID=132925 RepID=UPI001C0AD78C|nr:hypothetical protein [Clostridium bowmanii]MBU3190438.1 hypothetical protein [Clostridium bowmanii]MCA1074952.1 hypothetical protein [Clostridium bowmanii]
MYRTMVCKSCDNNKVIIEKVEQQLYMECSKCKNTIMKAVCLEPWNENIDNTYKLRINMKHGSLIEADIIEREDNKEKSKTLMEVKTKIHLMYVKEYEFIRQLGEDEYIEISNLDSDK